MSFVCQQCQNRIQMDSSLADLNPSAYDMVVASLPPTPTRPFLSEEDKLAQLRAPSSSKQAWQHAAHTRPHPSLSSGTKSPRMSGPAESFVMLQDSVVRTIPTSPVRPVQPMRGRTELAKPEPVEVPEPDPAPKSHHLRSTQRLLNLLSERTDIDHPLCAECTRILLSSLERRLEEARRERDGYLAFEKDIRKDKEREARNGVPPQKAKEDGEKKLQSLREEEKLAIEQLKQAEREREQLEEEMRALDLEEKVLEEEEAEFWNTHNAHLLVESEQLSQLAAIRAAYANDAAVLEKLERTNVYNDAFCIGHDGVFGTINGLRLGRIAGVAVDWAEINAAWGQTVLLLHTMARRLDFTFDNHRLIPMGSFSRIERTSGDKASYELHGSGDLALGRLLHNRRFDLGMVAFLDCLRQLGEHVRSQDSGVELPHAISKDKIGDMSIKLQFNQEEIWTRALRHVLLALKILLKWTTSGNA